MKVRSYRWRPFLYRNEVPEKVLAREFDHLPEETDHFLRYRGMWFHLSDFVYRPPDGWDGVHFLTYDAGVVIRVSKDMESYQIGRFVGGV